MTTARPGDDQKVLTLMRAMDAFFVARRPRKDSPHTGTGVEEQRNSRWR